MAVAKRVFLFIVVNLLVLITISITLGLLGLQPYLTAYGIDYRLHAVFCLVWGMGGALISLALSRVMARMAMGVKVIDPATAEPATPELVNTVHNLARAAGLPKMSLPNKSSGGKAWTTPCLSAAASTATARTGALALIARSS